MPPRYLDDLAAFSCIARNGSFTRAMAEQLLGAFGKDAARTEGVLQQ